MENYLVTGGAGFIGSNFIAYMLGKYEDIRIVNLDLLTYAGNLENLRAVERDPRYVFVHGDVSDSELVSGIFAKYDITRVIHFAAESHVDRSIVDPGAFVRTNVFGTFNLLECAKNAWLNTSTGTWRENTVFHQVGTDEVYGSLGQDGFFTEETPLMPHSPYSSSKASADMFVKSYHDTFGMPVTITRCSNNYGPYQFPEKLIPLMINNALQHRKLPIYGDGLQVRDWLYVTDHCKAIDLVARNGRRGEVYNVGGHNERTNIFIIETIIDRLREKLGDDEINHDLISHVSDRPGHDRRYGIDPSKIKRDIGWYPETPFEEGIKLTIDWYLANTDWMDNVVSGSYTEYYEKMYGTRRTIDV